MKPTLIHLLTAVALGLSVSAHAQEKTADEIAKELANPNTAMASLNFKNQYRWYEGDLPQASDQSNYSLLFQPSMPFPREDGSQVMFRPAIPVLVDQPVFNTANNDFDTQSGVGDIVFDLAYAPKTESGLLIAYGVVSSLPVASNNLGSDRWTLGPELLIGKITSTSVLGMFPNHQWDVAGSGDADISLTSCQFFGTLLPGGGWNYGSSPIISYDWENDQWNLPLQINIGKTVILGGKPWKLSAELNYYIEKSDAMAAEWMLGINITPVVENKLAGLFQ